MYMKLKVMYKREFKEGIFIILHILSHDKLFCDYCSIRE